VTGRCRTTGKIKYVSKTKADRALHTLENHRLGDFAAAHAYRCPDSPSHWHIGNNDLLDQRPPVGTPGRGEEKRRASRWNGAEWDQATMLLWSRCRDTCDWCGTPLAGEMARHHRQRRAIGGDRLSNLVALHTECHTYVHAHPEEARERGAIVSSYAEDPAAVPLLLPDGRAVLLTDEGGLCAA
jgi:hypothetical protein